MKGQLFISDVLASVLVVTIIISFAAWEFETIYNRTPDAEYDKVYLLANDISQMAVKNILANRTFGTAWFNVVNESRWNLLAGNLTQMILPPYGYNVSISSPTAQTPELIGNSGCASKKNVAVARRIVYTDAVKTLTVKVCA